jgi:hypothetical protein
LTELEQIDRALSEIGKLAETLISLREAGFTHNAIFFPRSYAAMELLCAWNNIPVDKAPKGWWFFPDQRTKEAWERVAKVKERSNGNT